MEPVVIKVLRARSVGDHHPQKFILEIVEQIDTDVFSSIKEARTLFNLEGATVADALMKSLPGGTIDALLIELLRRKASLLAVPL